MRLMAKRFTTTLLLASLALLAACSHTEASKTANAPSKETIQAGQRLFDERCKTVAGDKIYRTVPDVEGIVLLKVRHKAPPDAWNDRDWPGAALAIESWDDDYIRSFLAYEYAFKRSDGVPMRIRPPKERGAILTENRTDVVETHFGYRFVDVQDEQTGQWWRYSGSVREVPFEYSKFNGGDGKIHIIKRFVLDKVAAPATRPRYGVTFEDHVIPEERVFGLASGTIKVIDLQTKEVLGEATRYAWTPGVLFQGPKGANAKDPWLSAYACGHPHTNSGVDTRLFVDQVLQPLQDHRE